MSVVECECDVVSVVCVCEEPECCVEVEGACSGVVPVVCASEWVVSLVSDVASAVCPTDDSLVSLEDDVVCTCVNSFDFRVAVAESVCLSEYEVIVVSEVVSVWSPECWSETMRMADLVSAGGSCTVVLLRWSDVSSVGESVRPVVGTEYGRGWYLSVVCVLV